VGTIITDGVVEDEAGYRWDLPSSVTIPLAGQAVVTATAQKEGAITAAAGTITRITTPTRGWQSVTTVSEAVVGAPVESDAALRRRQSVSTALPAQTVLEGLVGAVANLPGVTAWAGYENDTSAVNALGMPANSITMVVQGGDVQDIAATIAAKKAPGTGTHGTTSTLVFDSRGVPATIRFYQATQVPVEIEVTIKALGGYLSTTGAKIVEMVVAYITDLGIGAGDKTGGGKVYHWKVGAVAALMGTGLENTFEVTGVTMRRDADPFAATDIDIAFNEMPGATTAGINLTVV
jgi:uncharacterized phage protein gp47/JayE